MTLNCVKPIQSSVIQIIHHNVGLKIFAHLPKMCLFVIIITYIYFTYISQGSVKMHLWCGGMYNNHITGNCPLSVPVKKF